MARYFISNKHQPKPGTDFRKIILLALLGAIACETLLLWKAGKPPVQYHYECVCKVHLEVPCCDSIAPVTHTPALLAEVLSAHSATIAMATRAYNPGKIDIMLPFPASTPQMKEVPVLLAVDPNFIDLFRFAILAGDGNNALRSPESLVLTAHLARQLFGSPQKAVGQSLLIGKIAGKVSAVVEDRHSGDPVQFDLLLPISQIKVVERHAWNWNWLKVDTWVRLQQPPTPSRIAALEAQLPALIHRCAAPSLARIGADTPMPAPFIIRFQPLSPVLPSDLAVYTAPGNLLSTSGFSKQQDTKYTFGVLGFHLKSLLCFDAPGFIHHI